LKNILISSVGAKVNVVKYCRRALANLGGGKVIACDVDTQALAKEFSDEFVVCPLTSSSAYEDWLIQAVKDKHIELIIPTRDGELEFYARLKQKLLQEFSCHVVVSNSEVLEVCLDKLNFYRWCSQNGYAHPSVINTSEVTQESFPLISKPRRGSASNGIQVYANFQDWQTSHQGDKESDILQTFVEGQEYSIDIYVSSNGSVECCVPRKRLMLAHGESVRAEVELRQDIVSECTKLVEDLHAQGILTVQGILKEDQFYFTEVNARIGGGFSLAIEAGADFIRYLVAQRRGLEYQIDQSSIQNETSMLRVQKDIFKKPNTKNIWCFDLDGTLCTESCPYENAQPIEKSILQVNALYEAGHTIVIATARGAASGKDWSELTKKQLFDWGVLYHRLEATKPYADFYVDNKAVDILDF
jgi:carbamoyl-phosphate synthase large subunit